MTLVQPHTSLLLRRVLLLLAAAVLLIAVTMVIAAPPAQARTTACANVIHDPDPGPSDNGAGNAVSIRATGLSCRTARGVVRFYGCHQRPPRGWRKVSGDAYPTVLRNGRWKISFGLAGGPLC